MHRLISAALLLDKIKIVALETFRANSTLLKLEHFVSLALVVMGICSRLYKLCHIWVNQIEECYHFLYQWSACFPSGLKNKEQVVFESQHNLHCEADTLKAIRAKYAEETMKYKSSIRHKVHLETFIANQAVVDKVKEVIQLNDDDELDFEDLGEVIQR
ncbi:uncharacterized protein B0P05DRAFT_577270 [Gilbertella persicaria]|uniref:uncharacterized protein n=1 Tax=Gilbertella persicaria TaxID=101096 RepID=UPI00222047E2|nr:uncharacterized protein B0P05DRAFT_577270 [Gilbertella persicaria]KAI8092422.1 hypothetical protein B0P05DRAFT_577270 [Gilbertella persicaria]